jgi:hypothetical protein
MEGDQARLMQGGTRLALEDILKRAWSHTLSAPYPPRELHRSRQDLLNEGLCHESRILRHGAAE